MKEYRIAVKGYILMEKLNACDDYSLKGIVISDGKEINLKTGVATDEEEAIYFLETGIHYTPVEYKYKIRKCEICGSNFVPFWKTFTVCRPCQDQERYDGIPLKHCVAIKPDGERCERYGHFDGVFCASHQKQMDRFTTQEIGVD
jgi:hypothetical protein